MMIRITPPRIDGYERVSCPVCESAPNELWMHDGKPTRYLHCLGCGTVYASPRTSRTSRFAWLNTTFAVNASTLELTKMRHSALGREATVVKSLKKAGRVLDIGCSTGALFEFFGRESWQCYGVELSPTAAAYAAHTYGAKVHTGTLQSSAFPGNHFDVVTLIDMFYYVDDPRTELKEVARVIRENGLLGIEIPGQAYTLSRSRGILCFLLEGRWTRLQTDSSYLYWYNPQSLERLLDLSGFKVVEWRVIGSPTKGGISGILSKAYCALMERMVKKWPSLLTWSPKCFCLAIPKPTTGLAIQRAQRNQAVAIVMIHQKWISGDLSLEPEAIEFKFLKAYYEELITRDDSVIFVATDENRVIGYCVLVASQPKVLIKLGLRRWGLVLRSLITHGGFSLTILKYFWGKFRSEVFGGKWVQNLSRYKGAYELRSVAVNPSHRTLAIGTKLLQASLEHACQMKQIPVIAWVGENNLPSRRLFEKVGFVVAGEKAESQGKVYLYIKANAERAIQTNKKP